MGWLRNSIEDVGERSLLIEASKRPNMTDEEYVQPYIDRGDAFSRGIRNLGRFSAIVAATGAIGIFAYSSEVRVDSGSEPEVPPAQPPVQCPVPDTRPV